MSDEDLIGYAFDLLDPDDRAAVAARLEADPEAAARLDALRMAAAPLLAVAEAERDEPPEPPPGLAVRAIARVAGHVVEHEPRAPDPVPAESVVATFLREFAAEPAEPPELEFGPGTRAKRPEAPTAEPRPAPPPSDGPDYRGAGRLRADILVAACIALVGVSLVFSGIAKARHESRAAACRNSLRTLYKGLADYADNDRQGLYPQVGTARRPTADAFAPELVDLGWLPPGYKPGCPAAPDSPAYTYTLGFRGPNDELIGLRRPTPTSDPTDEGDLMPISADYPSAAVAPMGGPVSPHGRTMNVLFVGGNVRATTSANVGPRGDDIYRNVFGHVAAGANRSDAVLGGAGTRP
jgi:prepilin-type processing-associated H-X9-DG protein